MLERGPSTVPENARAPELPLSLPGEINGATRNLHTTLNRLITSRLPLALPPHATDPSLYSTGLLHFAHIFLTFESLWADILRDYSPQTHSANSLVDSSLHSPPMSPLLSYLLVNPYDSPALFTSTLGAPTPPSPQLVAFLQTLRPRGLLRSARVKKDLEHLMGLHPTDLEVLLANYPGDKVADFCTHIRKTVHQQPWTLVSYAWCFYMAIFSGGRWIRAGLRNAGAEFWQIDPQEQQDIPAALAARGLSFWHFPGEFDGEDIKLEFKTRLAAAEPLFTSDERVDIIEEAKNIFQLCANLVDELDEMVGSTHSSTSPADHTKEGTEKNPTLDTKIERLAPVTVAIKTGAPFTQFVRRPGVKGTLVALACLACIALARIQ